MGLKFVLELELPENTKREPNFVVADVLGAVVHDLNTSVSAAEGGTKLRFSEDNTVLVAHWKYEGGEDGR